MADRGYYIHSDCMVGIVALLLEWWPVNGGTKPPVICKRCRPRFGEADRRTATLMDEDEKQKDRPQPTCTCGIIIAEAGRLCPERDCFYK